MRRNRLQITACLGVLMLLVTTLSTRAFAGTLTQDLPLNHGGVTRYFDAYVPATVPATPMPLMILIHGGGQESSDMQSGPSSEFLALADSQQFLLLMPNGTTAAGTSSPSGAFNWNDCRSDAGPANTPADDVGFISALIDWAESNYSIDPERVYATGSSNGGLMSFRLALELSDRIAAIGAVIANLPANSECPATPGNSIAVLIMNGAAETYFMPWAGGQVSGNRGQVVSAQQTRDYWRAQLGVSPTATHIAFTDLNLTDNGSVSLDLYCGGSEGSSLEFYTVSGGGHVMPSVAHYIGAGPEALVGKQNRDIEGAAEIWKFLSRHRLNGTAGTTQCGDGCVDAGEVCDDRNTLDDDCCGSTCQAAKPCALCESCDLGSGACVEGPRPSCQALTSGGKATFSLRNAEGEKRDRLSWQWLDGSGGSVGGFGNPAAFDDYQLCVWDSAPVTPVLLTGARIPAAGTCRNKPCWTQLADTGFRYRNRDKTPDGINAVRLQPSSKRKGRATLSGSGPYLSNRAGALPPLPPSTTLRVQLQGTGGACYEANYGPADVLTDSSTAFKARVKIP